jgi:hypothetical protein
MRVTLSKIVVYVTVDHEQVAFGDGHSSGYHR